ncbi:RNase III domain-containing protein [[Candida] zeylanoides]
MSIGLSNKDMLTWCDDLHTLKGSVSQLQSALNTIVAKAPSAVDYELLVTGLEQSNASASVVERARSLLQTPQARVGVRLKELYDSQQLPFLALLNKVNFRSPNSDKWVGYLRDYVPPPSVGKEVFQLINAKPGAAAPVGARYPPSLPPLDDRVLAKVLTDKSLRQPSDFIESASLDDFSSRHNAKLALRGRRTLEHALVDIIDARFPSSHEDDLYLLQYKLMSPSILTKFAFGYNLVDEARVLVSPSGVSTETKLQLLSNIFLAYIGAVVAGEEALSFEEIKLWLGKLYDPIIADIHRLMQENHMLKPVENLARAELDYLLGGAIEYVVSGGEEAEHVVDVRYKGQVIGEGVSSEGIEHAKLRAAQAVFEEKSKLDEILMAEGKGVKKEHAEPPSAETSAPASPVAAPPATRVAAAASPAAKVAVPMSFYGAPPPPPGREPDPDSNYNLLMMKNFSKKNLHSILAKHDLVPIYKYSKNNKEHMVTILVDDIVLAKASAANKKIASQNAAQIAIGNKETLELLFTRAKAQSNHTAAPPAVSPPGGSPNLPQLPPQ